MAEPGISIITCTKRRYCMDSLFHNYHRQKYAAKELIIILNHHSLRIEEYRKAAKRYHNVRIFSLPAERSLGYCLNFGVKASRYSLIAKFDDDDYYAPHYLADSRSIMRRTKADIVGKRAHYMYLNSRKLLLLRYQNLDNQYVPLVQGATLLVKRHVFDHIRFPDRNRGECVKFCSDSRAKGFKIYSGNKYNFLAFRRRNSRDHTWIVSDKNLLSRNVKVQKVKNAKQFVCRGQ